MRAVHTNYRWNSSRDMAWPFFIRRGTVVAAIFLACMEPELASAQWRVPRGSAAVRSEAPGVTFAQEAIPASGDLANSIIIAALGSAAGILVGGLTGASIDAARDVPSEDAGLSGFIYGGLAGSALFSPSLLYLANDRRGPLGRALLLSIAGTSLVTLLLWPHDAVLVAVPVVQIGVAVALLQ